MVKLHFWKQLRGLFVIYAEILFSLNFCVYIGRLNKKLNFLLFLSYSYVCNCPFEILCVCVWGGGWRGGRVVAKMSFISMYRQLCFCFSHYNNKAYSLWRIYEAICVVFVLTQHQAFPEGLESLSGLLLFPQVLGLYRQQGNKMD